MCNETCTTDCGKCKGGLSYRYEFFRYEDPERFERVWFGPYPQRENAAIAFQWAYGFNPTFTGNREVY